MEGRPLDPVAVREAIDHLARHCFLHEAAPQYKWPEYLPHLRLLLAALDEGREASAPLVAAAAMGIAASWSDRIRYEVGADLSIWRRLAAWSEAVSEPEGKNDGR